MHCMNSVQIAEGPMGVQADQRLTQRHASRLRVAKLISAGSEELCVIKNLSSNGAMVRIYGEHRVEDPVTVEIDGRRSINGTIVWVERSYAGIAFDGVIDASEVLGRALPGDPIAFMPRAPRFKMEASDAVRIAGRDEAIDMFDISQGGAKIGNIDIGAIGETVLLNIKGFGLRKGQIRWHDADASGIAFETPIALHDFAVWAATQRHAH